MIRFLLFISFIIIGESLHSQRIIQPKLVDLDLKGVVYKKEWSLDFKIMENGLAIGYNSGDVQSYHRTKYYNFELGISRDPRERRQNKNYSFSPLTSSRSFIYGKINHFINVRAGLGFKKYLSEKAKRKGLAVGYSYSFGPSIGILKPYYLVLIYRSTEIDKENEEYRHESYNENNADKFLTLLDIFGSSSALRGFKHIKVVPGIQGKFATHFALGAFDKYVKSVEAGIMVDLYIKKIDIMLESEEIRNKPYFIRLFASAQFGMRKNR